MVPDPREDKLPVWARTMLAGLRQRVEEDHQRREAESSMDDADTVLDPHADVPVGAGRGTLVRFVLRRDDLQAYIDVHVTTSKLHGRYLYLRGGDSIAVRPVAGNACHIQIPERSNG